MTLRPLADAVALWQPDPAQQDLAVRRLTQLDGVELPDAPAGWVVGVRRLPGTDLADLWSPEHGLMIVQGADLLGGTRQIDDTAWRAIAADLRNTTGYCAGKTTGDFAIALLEPGGHIRVFQSHAALMPMLITATPVSVAWSSSLDLIAQALEGDPEPDRAILATWCNGVPFSVPGRSVLRGVAEYPRGSRLDAAPGRPAHCVNCDTELLGEPFENRHLSRKQCGDWLRDIVLANLRRDLSPTGGNLLALSGGRDSSTLASLVHQHLELPLTTASLLPPDPAERARELSFAEPALTGLPQDQRIVLDRAHKDFQAICAQLAPQTIQPVLHPMLCLLERIAADRDLCVYFGGEFCDELIGGEPVLDEWLAEIGLMKALRLIPIRSQRGVLGLKSLLRERFDALYQAWRALRGAPLPQLLSPQFATDLQIEVRGLLQQQLRHHHATPAHRVLHRYQMSCTPAINMNWAACAALGIRRSIPLVSREVLSLLVTTPAAHRLYPETKELWSAAFGRLVPEQTLSRPDKGGWGANLPEIEQALPPLEDSWSLLRHSAPDTSGVLGRLQYALAMETQKRLCYARSLSRAQS